MSRMPRTETRAEARASKCRMILIAIGVTLIAAPQFVRMPMTIEAAPTVTRSLVTRTVAEATAVWRPSGLLLDWRVAAATGAVDRRSGLTVVIDEDPGLVSQGPEQLGWIRFTAPNMPEPLIHLSRRNAADLMNRTASLRETTIAWKEVLLGRALGRALAHELGHYLLKSAVHTETGLMRVVRPSADFFSIERTGFEITPAQRDLVARDLASDDVLTPCSPPAIERKQAVIGRPDALVLFEEHSSGEEPERHAVAAVPERKEMPRVTAVWTDVRQTVGRRRKQALPRVFETDAGKRGIQPHEVVADRFHAFG